MPKDEDPKEDPKDKKGDPKRDNPPPPTELCGRDETAERINGGKEDATE